MTDGSAVESDDEVCTEPACSGACGRAVVETGPMDRATSVARMLLGFGNGLAMLYGGPLYLVGSICTSPTPGDVDLRLCLDRATCVLYWGDDFGGPSWEAKPGWIARKREELKQSRRLTRTFRGKGGLPRFDFQFQCSLFKGCDDVGNGVLGEPIGHDGKPRIRVDTIANEWFAAGMGDP